MGEALDQADKAVPTSWPEFARLLGHMACGGQTGIDEDNAKPADAARPSAASSARGIPNHLDAALAEYRRLKAIFDDMPSGTDARTKPTKRPWTRWIR